MNINLCLHNNHILLVSANRLSHRSLATAQITHSPQTSWINFVRFPLPPTFYHFLPIQLRLHFHVLSGESFPLFFIILYPLSLFLKPSYTYALCPVAGVISHLLLIHCSLNLKLIFWPHSFDWIMKKKQTNYATFRMSAANPLSASNYSLLLDLPPTFAL